MNYDEILERIENAETQETILELKTTIALSCDDDEITEAEYHELRNMCDLLVDELPTEQALNDGGREDLEQTYYQLTRLR